MDSPIAWLLAASIMGAGCSGGVAKPNHRERAAIRDTACSHPKLPAAYFYPADNRTNYKPDHPDRDGCTIIVPDHLFCCPNAPRSSDR